MALTVKIRGDATHLEKTLRGVKSGVGGLASGLAKFTAAGAGFAAMMAGINSVEAVVTKLGQVLADSSKEAANMETLSVQFEVLAGSAETAKNLIAEFREEATKSALSTKDYADAGKTLMAFGVSAEETMPILKMLGDVSMGNSERFASLALAFSQTQAAGRLMGQEVIQFVNAGFNPLQEISRKTGRSMIDLKKAMEDYAISSDMVTEAFKSATSEGGLFFGAIERGSATFEGKMAKMRDSVQTLKIAFGTGMNEGLKVALDAVNAGMPKLEERFTAMGDSFGKAISDGVTGNYEIIAAAAAVVGAAFSEGISMAAREGPLKMRRSIVQLASDKFGLAEADKKLALRIAGREPLEPRQMARDLARATSDERQNLQETIRKRELERHTEELRLNRMATEELIRRGLKLDRETIEKLKQEMFSR